VQTTSLPLVLKAAWGMLRLLQLHDQWRLLLLLLLLLLGCCLDEERIHRAKHARSPLMLLLWGL
jgi:hypothetical protein